MNTDKRDLNGFKRFVLGFYLKISVHLRLSVVKKELLNSLLNTKDTKYTKKELLAFSFPS